MKNCDGENYNSFYLNLIILIINIHFFKFIKM